VSFLPYGMKHVVHYKAVLRGDVLPSVGDWRNEFDNEEVL